VNWLDGAVIVVVLWFTYAAFSAGFIRETVTVVSALLGVVLAGLFYQDLQKDVLLAIDNEETARIVAFGIIFGAVVLAGQIAATLLKPTVHVLQLGIFDQLAGAAFGFLKAAVIIEAFLLVFVTYDKFDLRQTIDESMLGSWMVDQAPFLTRVLPDEFEAAADAYVN
jgi:membrane protein required for colicin V production